MHDADSKTGDSAPSVSLRSAGPTLSRPWPGKRWRAAAEQEEEQQRRGPQRSGSATSPARLQDPHARPSPTTTSHETAPPGPYARYGSTYSPLLLLGFIVPGCRAGLGRPKMRIALRMDHPAAQ
ncbi:hypothetical protein AcW1_001201 [Taiwanofungus camphoratus]|nr:hypothetical protein AcW1_001201 [Antrodia cinnamomea]